MENNGQFIPHPTTWLNRGGWDDEIEIETEFTQAELDRIERGLKMGQNREDIIARIREDREYDARHQGAVFY